MMRLFISSMRGVRRHLWMWTLLALITVLIGVLPVLAQPAPSGQSDGGQPMAFDIPAQPLTSALHSFAETSGLQVSFPSDMAAGVSSPGLSGSYTPEAALQLLLSGTGLTHRFTDPATVTLVPGPAASTVQPSAQHDVTPTEPIRQSSEAQQSKPIKVPEIVVKDVREREYTADETTGAMRIPVPVQDLPRSVEVVTRQLMDDQKVIRLQDALRNVSGVSMPITQGGRAGDFMIRGFRSDLNVFKNGFREDSTFGARGSREIINVESIEVIKGPPSYLYGRSDPGGVISPNHEKSSEDSVLFF